jgi:tRNA A37 N6-isopentenylltransferase MiaA
VSLAEEARRLLAGLTQAGVAFIVVGGSGALMQGVPMVTFDLDIVPSRDAANVERLLAWLATLDERRKGGT